MDTYVDAGDAALVKDAVATAAEACCGWVAGRYSSVGLKTGILGCGGGSWVGAWTIGVDCALAGGWMGFSTAVAADDLPRAGGVRSTNFLCSYLARMNFSSSESQTVASVPHAGRCFAYEQWECGHQAIFHRYVRKANANITVIFDGYLFYQTSGIRFRCAWPRDRPFRRLATITRSPNPRL